MMFFKRKKEVEKVKELELGITSAFVRVRNDVGVLYQWVDYLSGQNKGLQTQIDKLQREINLVPKTANEIRLLVDKHYSFDQFFKRLDAIEQRLSQSEQRSRIFKADLREPQISYREPKTALEQKVIRRLTQNSKDYIKNMLISLISKYEKISALQLREMVVEEQGLCSKSSFYRLLEELEGEQTIKPISDGKVKVLALKTAQL